MNKWHKVFNKIALTVIIVALVFGLGSYGQLDTQHNSYVGLRYIPEGSGADTAMLATAGDFAQIPSAAKQLRTDDSGRNHGGNIAEIVMMADQAGSFTYTVYAWRRTNGMARKIATGTATIGTQAVVKYPDTGVANSWLYVDQMTVTNTWITTASSSDETGSNGVCSLTFDMCGYEWFYVEFTSFTAVTGIKAYMSWY